MMIGNDAIGTNAVGSSGTASSPAQLACAISAVASVTATLTTAIALSAVLSSQSTSTSNLITQVSLQASIQSVSSVVSYLIVPNLLQASLSAQSNVSGVLSSTQVIPMFIPSSARTINVLATSPVFTGGKWWTLTDPKRPRGLKDPNATIDITFDWSDWLNDIGSVQISDVTFTLNGASSVGSFSDGTKVTVFVSGGTAGSAATVACLIKTLTTPSRTDERTIYLDIADE